LIWSAESIPRRGSSPVNVLGKRATNSSSPGLYRLKRADELSSLPGAASNSSLVALCLRQVVEGFPLPLPVLVIADLVELTPIGLGCVDFDFLMIVANDDGISCALWHVFLRGCQPSLSCKLSCKTPEKA
jgi:hypothetical protein